MGKPPDRCTVCVCVWVLQASVWVTGGQQESMRMVRHMEIVFFFWLDCMLVWCWCKPSCMCMCVCCCVWYCCPAVCVIAWLGNPWLFDIWAHRFLSLSLSELWKSEPWKRSTEQRDRRRSWEKLKWKDDKKRKRGQSVPCAPLWIPEFWAILPGLGVNQVPEPRARTGLNDNEA